MPTPYFSGFHSPNYTMVPDQVFDELLAQLSGAELKVLLYIIRRTFGFKRGSDAISLSQMLHGITCEDGRVLDHGVGLSKPTLLIAIRSLLTKQIIQAKRQRSVEKGDEATVYTLRFSSKTEEKEEAVPRGKKTLPPPVVKKVDQGVVKKSYPQYTDRQYTDISNIRKEKADTKQKEAPSLEEVYAETTVVLEEQGSGGAKPPIQTVADQNILAQAVHEAPRLPRQVKGAGSKERELMLTRISQFATEFSDRASLKSSTSRADNLLAKSGMALWQFDNCLWEAHAIVRERIRNGEVMQSRMGYFFSVLEERVSGGKEGKGDASERGKKASVVTPSDSRTHRVTK